MITWNDFKKIDIRAGTILRIERFLEVGKPSYRIWVDLNLDLGVKKYSAPITAYYQLADLTGNQVACVVNWLPKQIANFISEVLIACFSALKNEVVFISMELPVPNGSRLF